MFTKIRQFEQSELTKSDFCSRHRIRHSQFHYWLKIYQSNVTAEHSGSSFIPVMIEDVTGTTDHDRIIVTGHGGVQVSFPAQPASIPLIRQLLED